MDSLDLGRAPHQGRGGHPGPPAVDSPPVLILTPEMNVNLELSARICRNSKRHARGYNLSVRDIAGYDYVILTLTRSRRSKSQMQDEAN
jgi:hypothetical protein